VQNLQVWSRIMNAIDEMDIDHAGSDVRKIILGSGSIDSIPEGIQPDYLAIYCRPGSYDPAQGGLVGLLAEMGVSVDAEQTVPEIDFRPTLPCWVSRDLSSVDIPFKRLLVWEPAVEEGGTLLNKVEEAFQSLDRTAGKRGAPFLLLPLWTEVTSDTQLDIFRMQFYTAAALAARARWQTIYMLVNSEAADEMAELFGTMKLQYLDPPRVIPEMLEQFASFGIPTRLSEVKIDRESARQEPWPGLTQRQHAAIYDYSQLAYLYTNRALRQNDFAHPDFIALQAYIEALSTGLANLPNYLSGERVNRSVSIFEGIEELYIDGQVTHELAFTSTSARDTPVGVRRYRLQLKSMLGKDISEISNSPLEKEVLFDYSMRHLVSALQSVPEDSVVVTCDEGTVHSLGLVFTHL
jgi:hypothetical protein